MNPVKLNTFGEELLEEPPEGQLTDLSTLSNCYSIGVHAMCKGYIDLHSVSPLYNRLVCRSCGPIPRGTIPKTIKTYGGLRQYFQEQIKYENLKANGFVQR